VDPERALAAGLRAGVVAPPAGATAPAASRPADPAPGLDRVGRDGVLRLEVERRGSRTVLARAGWVVPLQVLAPAALDDPACVISVLNPTGGLVGGDRLTVEVTVGAGAHACVTTPSASRVYRTLGPPAEQQVRLRVGPGAALEWVPEHTIPYPGSALVQSIAAEVAEGGRLIAVDAFAAGRVVRGEAWQFARLDAGLVVRDAVGLLFADRVRLAGGPGAAARYRALGLAEGHDYFATVVVVGVGRPTDWPAGIRPDGGATVVGAPLSRRGAVARVLAVDAPALVAATETLWAGARRAVLGLPPLDLRRP
jgi:urease accessory protein